MTARNQALSVFTKQLKSLLDGQTRSSLSRLRPRWLIDFVSTRASVVPARRRGARVPARPAGREIEVSDDMKIDPSRHYPTSTAAQFLGVSASTVRDLERQGRLTCTRTPGGQRRFAGSDLLRLREESPAQPPRKATPTSAHVAGTTEDAKARQAWLGALIAGAQRGLPADTSGEIRLRLGADIERALRPFGPAATVGDLQPLVKSLVEQATQQWEAAQGPVRVGR